LSATSKKFAEDKNHCLEKLYIPWFLTSAFYGSPKRL
jgi:hypothetical protein